MFALRGQSSRAFVVRVALVVVVTGLAVAVGAPAGTAREAGDHEVWSAVFSPNGRLVLTGSHDGRARIWDAASGRLLHTLRHTDMVNSAVFSPDGKRVVTAGWDDTARLWDVASGRSLYILRHAR